MISVLTQLCLTLCNPMDFGLQQAAKPACWVSLSIRLFRQEYWIGLPFPSPGNLPDPEIEPMSPASPALAGRFFTTEPPWKPRFFWLHPAACGILVPWPGTETVPFAVEAQSPNHRTTRATIMSFLINFQLIVFSHSYGLNFSVSLCAW